MSYTTWAACSRPRESRRRSRGPDRPKSADATLWNAIRRLEIDYGGPVAVVRVPGEDALLVISADDISHLAKAAPVMSTTSTAPVASVNMPGADIEVRGAYQDTIDRP